METKNFRCTQQELYAVCRLGWSSCSQNIDQFSTIKSKYSPEFVKERIAEVETVATMPDSYQRRASIGKLRVDLRNNLKHALTQWRILKRHISEAWPKQDVDSFLNSAGLPFYDHAYSLKWEAASSLLNNGNAFIREHREKLLANNNMTETFAEEFNAVYLSYMELYQTYLEAIKNAQLGTEKVLNAHNKLHAELMSMFADAKTVFANDGITAKQFVFENVLKQVSGSNMAGLRGKVTNGAVPAVEIPGILITIKELGESTEADEEGRFIFSPLAAGLYTVEVVAKGYKSQSIPGVEVKTSTMATLNIVLEHL